MATVGEVVSGILSAPLNEGVGNVQHALQDTRVIARRSEMEMLAQFTALATQISTLTSEVAAIKAKLGA